VKLRFVLASLLLLFACRGETNGNKPSSSGPGVGGSAAGGAMGGAGGSGASGGGPQGGMGAGSPITGPVILQGTVVVPDQAYDGQVLIEGDTITCVAPANGCEDVNPNAVVIDTGAIIAPGLIDTHNHILFDIFDLDDWGPNLPATCGSVGDCNAHPYCSPGECDCVGGACFYTDHTEWPKEDEYGLMLDYKQCLEDASQGKPVWCPIEFDGVNGRLKCEMDKFGELKGIVAGTTSIVGLPGNSAKCFGSLARSIDRSQNDLPDDKIQTSALFPPSTSSGNGVCVNYTDGDTTAYLIHVGEGTDQSSDAMSEFAELGALTTTPGCLYAPQTSITHGTAFTATEFAVMAAASMKLTWSPASNVALYGTTTDIPAALAAGVVVSLAPDWSMGGSQNLLDELAFAKQWSDANWAGALSDQQLVEMVTINAAAALGLANTIGRLQSGMLADVIVVQGDTANPYAAIVDATPADVSLVMVGGVALYGDASTAYEQLAPLTPGCEQEDVCGTSKFLCVAEDDTEDLLDQTLVDIRGNLGAALLNLDNIPTANGCSPPCASDEQCFTRTVHPIVPVSNCGGSCPAGDDCFQTAMSGNNQFNCRSIVACSPTKTKGMAPLTPLVTCN
jgi:5-methylthioadenosine/S-adenosylhomocysteine deaminase